MRKLSTHTTMALVLTAGLAAAGATSAQTTAPTVPVPNAPAPADAPRGSGDARVMHQAIQEVRVSLSQAIDTAEAQGGGGGRAVEAEFERAERNEPAHYEVKVLQADGRLVEHYIDATTGQVTKSENQPVERYFTRLKPEDIRAARTSLKQAIALAEQRGGAGARAVEAEVEREGAAVVYEVDVVTADRKQEIKVTADGQVTGG